MKIFMKIVYQYLAICFIFSPTSNHLHSLQVGNCDSNSRLVVDEDDHGKFRLERVNRLKQCYRRHYERQNWQTNMNNFHRLEIVGRVAKDNFRSVKM